MLSSNLDKIDGLGPKLKTNLIRHLEASIKLRGFR